MLQKKPVIWILDNHLENQKVFSEILEERYNLFFFDDAESLRNYRKVSPVTPELLIVSLATHQHDLSGLLAEGNYPAALAISPQEVPLLIAERATRHFDQVFAYPYSKTEIAKAIESLLHPIHWPINIVPLRESSPFLSSRHPSF